MLLAFPLVAAMPAVLCLLLVRLNRPEVERGEGVDGYIREERRNLGSMGTGSRNTLIAFGVAVTGMATLLGIQ